MTDALRFCGVIKCYGRRRALDGLDWTVPTGSVFGLVGSNGAGKTTAMAVAVGLLEADGGEIDLLGGGPFRAETHAGRVTLLPQDAGFPPHARVEELLRFYSRLQGTGEDSVESLLDWVHLTDRRRAAVRTLSHGMRRRLAIAQAFLGVPQLVFLDEPLNGLDPREAARIRELIRQRRGRQTIVISSHILSDIEALCDEVAFIEQGRCVRQDSLERLTRRAHCVSYRLRGLAPLEALQATLPEVQWSVRGEELTATYGDALTTEELNRRVLPVLLASGVGILEIRRGSDLEGEYLRTAAQVQKPA